jgi:hypothetical protein
MGASSGLVGAALAVPARVLFHGGMVPTPHVLAHSGRIETFTTRSSRALAVLTWGLAATGLALTLGTAGLAGARFAAPFLLLAVAGWVMFWRPAVVVSDAGVELRNPFRSIGVPWDALAHVDTKYALTLVAGGRRFTAWAAPAPGIWGARNARPEHLRGLPESTYGPARSVRPGDLAHTHSGQAAAVVRERWAEALASGAARAGRADATPVVRRTAWPEAAATALLAVATLLTPGS